MEFEWDERKDWANQAKHKISFELACLVFEDPLHLVKFDRVIDGEERRHLWAASKAGEFWSLSIPIEAGRVRKSSA
jgi:uncharacterized DUF497 family protein